MRRLPLILGLVLITGLIIHDIYEFFVTNEGIRYFSSESRRLLYATLCGIAGGIVVFGISRLLPGSQRTLKLTMLGAFGTLVLGVLGVLAYHLTRFAPMVTEAGMWGWIGAAFLSFAVLALLVWLEFHQAWRQT